MLVGCTVPGAQGQIGAASQLALQPSPPEATAATQNRPDIAPTTDPWVCPDAALSTSYEPTLFVAPNGSDANDGRSEDSPLRTLQAAADAVEPGDVVWVRAGTYASDVVFETSGTEGAPIVFESYPGECATLDGSSLDRERGITLEGVSHMRFRNFVVRNSPGEGVYMIDSHDNHLSNLRLQGNYYSGITTLQGDRNLFTYIVSRDNADADGGDADGISISSGDRNHVAYCVVFGNSDDGVDTWRATDTLVERCIAFGNGARGGDGNGFKAGGERPSANTVVRYSIAFDNRSNGFAYNSGRDVVFERNTAFGNDGYGFVASDATLLSNLATGNEKGPWYGEEAGADNEANSWQGATEMSRLREGSSGGLGGALPIADGIGAIATGASVAAAFRIDITPMLDESFASLMP